MSMESMRAARVAVRRTVLVAVAAGVSLAAVACSKLDDVLNVDTPTQVPATLLDRPEHAPLLVSGLVGDFECALGAYIVSQGLLGDELHDGTFTASRWPTPSRSLSGTETYGTNSCQGLGVYTPLSVARWSADDALRKLQGWTDAEVAGRQQKIATAAAYSGYSHTLMGEGMCTVAFDLSAELQPAEAFARAEDRFALAISAATAAGDAALVNMARVGRARALLNLGRTADAVADASLVPAGFVRLAEQSSSSARRWNKVSEETRTGRVSVKEPYRDLTVDGTPDPRVPVTDQQRFAGDAITPLWTQDKYPNDNADLAIARDAEARLIIAEVQGGQVAVDIINELRSASGLPAFSSTNAQEIQAQVLDERRRELFLEGQRLGDMRRLSLPLFPAAGAAYNKGGTYGDARCFPLPAVERRNNPNIS
jgi:starch-binding outer membrane protein, SusD/RagB family